MEAAEPRTVLDAVEQVTKILGTIFGIVGVLFAAYKGIAELRKGREENARKLRWDKMHAAKELLDELVEDEGAAAAMRMLDWDGREYEAPGGGTVTVKMTDVLAALEPNEGPWPPKAQMIRDSFDALFGHFERIEHFIQVGLVEFPDVTYPTGYYVDLMAKFQRSFSPFMREYDYKRCLRFCERFDSWRRDGQKSGSEA